MPTSITPEELLADIPDIPAGDPTTEQVTGSDTPTESKGKTQRRSRARPRKSPQPPPLSADQLPKKEPEDKQIEKVTSEILSFTAVMHATPMLPALQCDYCRDHILDTAPDTAKELVKLSHDYPALRGALVGITRFFGGVGALSIVGDLYGASIVHHGPEVPVLTQVGTIAYGRPTKSHPEGMPPRKPASKKFKGNPHAHSSATAGTAHSHSESTETS